MAWASAYPARVSWSVTATAATRACLASATRPDGVKSPSLAVVWACKSATTGCSAALRFTHSAVNGERRGIGSFGKSAE